MKKESKYDLIIIGAGSGSLAAAVKCATEGKKVLLVESGNKVGGYNAAVRAGRYLFDPDFKGIPAEFLGVRLEDRLKELGADVPYTVNEIVLRLLVTDGMPREYILPVGFEAFKNKVNDYCPESEESTSKFFALVEQTVEGVKALVYGATREKIKKDYPDYVRASAYTLDEVEETLDMPLRAREVINGFWFYLGLTPDKLDFATYALYLYTYVSGGVFKPDLGRIDVDYAYLKAFREKGGVALFNTSVEKIILKDGRAYAVVTDDGFINYAPEIITDLPDVEVYNSLLTLDSVAENARRIINTEKHAASVVTLCLGLDRSFDELGLDVAPTVVLPSSDYSSLNDRRKDWRDITAMSVEPREEGGKYILKLTAVYEEDTLTCITIDNKKKQEAAIAERLIKRFEKVFGISIRKNIDGYVVFSPLHYAHTVSEYGGSPLGLEPTSQNSVYVRWNRRKLADYPVGLECVGVNGLINCFGADYLSAPMAMNAFWRVEK